MKLRAPNVLFVDDNALNREEALFYNVGLHLMPPEEWAESAAYVIRVTDRFGDYGLCGVASVTGTRVVQDFAFSCRLLDMGVERAVLRYLDAEHGNLTAPFDLSGLAAPSDWVNVKWVEPQRTKDDDYGIDPVKVFMPAACFSDVVTPFLMPEFSVTGVMYPPV